jgi:hypothetical protein
MKKYFKMKYGSIIEYDDEITTTPMKIDGDDLPFSLEDIKQSPHTPKGNFFFNTLQAIDRRMVEKKNELKGEGYSMLVHECFECGGFVVGLKQCSCKGEE